MVRKSFGKMRGTRQKLRVKRKATVNDHVKEFEQREIVSVSLHSAESFPHPNFHGRTGRIIKKRGRSYEVSVKDGKATKTLFLKPVHLKGI